MKIVYINCTHFDDSSFIGGTERYVLCLAEHMSAYADTTIVSFSSKRQSTSVGCVKIELYPVRNYIGGEFKDPFSLQYLGSLIGSDIVHIHNVNVFISDFAAAVGSLIGKQPVVTDHGAFGKRGLSRTFPMYRCYKRAVAQSSFAKTQLPNELQQRAVIIKGGVDTSKFCPSPSSARESKILFVGRIVPEKGVRYLVEAIRMLRSRQHRLVIVGRVYDQRYYADLLRLSSGLPVTFIHNADDEAIIHEYQTAAVMVLPSLFRELMGQVVLESQACGTPVICSDAGALQEFVVHGQTGFVVKKANSEEIAAALDQLFSAPAKEQADRQNRCRQSVQALDWRRVAEKHSNLYRELLGGK